ncbi:hypothetical protein [uncultured Tenacibaculum sp.]|uniref:hypothetical protein n=1 Tax=uncultured Tenacibaculum sp. TaxID=174713 RepID=UPI002615D52E|nr:hypothetical protein [uncultured Tenacibaculum sp.]
MNRKLFFLILLIPNIFYCQVTFTVSNPDSLYSKVTSILKEKNVFPSKTQTSEIHITDLIDKNNIPENNITSGIYDIYYHYHWNSYLLFKNQNNFVLYINPLQNTKSILGRVLDIKKTKKDSKKYLKRIYKYLSYTITRKYHPPISFIPFTNKKELKKIKTNRKNKENSEQKKLKKEYKYYLKLVRKG